MDRIDTGGGFGLLDGAALVMGSAIASIHTLRVMRGDLTGAGWIMIWGTFAWVAVTAAGPFLFLARRFARHLSDYPKIGDRLWALLGIPWLLTAVLESAAPGSEPRQNSLYSTTLSLGLAIVSLITLGVIWNTWVMVSPEEATRVEASPWTNRLGLILAIAWPIQCGLGMVVLS
jgi:hypothetical protein